jgi:hypothetical protein
MDGMGNLVAQCSSKLVSVSNEIQERIDDVDVAAWGGERVWLSCMNQVELEGMYIGVGLPE